MRIAILSTSDSIGGAAIVAASLAKALAARGHETALFTLPGKRERKWPFLAERAEIFLRNGMRRDSLFKVSTGRFGSSRAVEQVKAFSPDTILLGWINQGFLSLDQITRLSAIAPTYWVMHDMWNFTGICHYSFGCMRFTGHCGECPMLAGFMRGDRDLSYKVWERKRRFYATTPVRFIAVSSWVKSMAARSSLLRERDVTVIPNVYPLDDLKILPKEPGLIAWGAERLDNPIKGLTLAVEALNRLPADANVRVAFFGDYKDVSSIVSTLKVPYELTGPLPARDVHALLGKAQVVLSTALYETFGNTLIEGQACGAVPVSFNRGGQVDIIDHKKSGFLADFGDLDAIARGIMWALSDSAPTPPQLRASAERNFSAASVAARYESLLQGS